MVRPLYRPTVGLRVSAAFAEVNVGLRDVRLVLDTILLRRFNYSQLIRESFVIVDDGSVVLELRRESTIQWLL